MNPTPVLTVVSPFFNEAEGIGDFLEVLRGELDGLSIIYEVILVDDGSTDNSRSVIEKYFWPELRVIGLPINLGHQVALDLGYRASKGDYVITLDSDLQHPPKLIGAFLAEARNKNVDVVYGIRKKRSEDSVFKRLSARAYYKAVRQLSGVEVQDSAADFRLISRSACQRINSLPAGGKVFRLLIPSLTLSSSNIIFEADKRLAGESKYSLSKMLRLALTSVVAFSNRPLWLAIQLGAMCGLVSLLGIIYVIYEFIANRTVPGWASISTAVLFMFSINFFLLGVLGLYLGELRNDYKLTETLSKLGK